ncbi:hypothetical protein TanjilG_18234 [Lupinus angustifolius]|uniref:Gem-associated protein 2 n=1 Tax=Lupinus angustifolius TaxID=3871 RepID=A0A1J7H2P0_LUPAN|nr:PREDICTED: gem-associated protein 2-like isoform X2 [Lupinus angustifolius]OIW06852.1 hypothetical protein TanjilG_18234 [Lupinus angustifolius]
MAESSISVVKAKYSIHELEALRFVNIDHQRKLWNSIFKTLQSRDIAKPYQALAATHHSNVKRNPPHSLPNKKSPPSILVCNENMDSELLMKSSENVSLDDPSCTHSLMDGDGCSNLEESSENDDSDDDYASIQRPAFFVKGEPNFDAGAPEDGWEYLRRVRWEAKQIPKVKVAKFDRSKLNKEQSAYMPKIPDIPECPEHLLPLKQWEDVFLAEFSALRANLSSLEDSNNLQPIHSPNLLGQQLASVMNMDVLLHHMSVDKAMDQPTDLTTEDKDTAALPPENPASKTSVDQISSGSPALPLLSAILGLDSVARVSMLHKRVRLLESEDAIARNDCMWLFALCAAVDAPLHADTSAALRGLLRKCASIRATKAELDEEVVMLNILATISGRYFGQSEN